MIIFLYGPDNYRLKQETNSVVLKYKQKHPGGLNFFSINLNNDDPAKLKEAVRTVSFFDDVKLILVSNSFADKKRAEAISEMTKEFDLINVKSPVMLFSENLEEKDLKTRNSKLFGILSGKDNLVRNFEVLEGRKFEDWVIKEFYDRGCNIFPAIARVLVQRIGSDTVRLISEIEKLSNFKLKGEIREEDLNLLVPADIEINIFNLLDAITSGNKAKAFELLYKELKTGRDPHYLLTMVVYQLRNSLIVKDLLSRKLTSSEIAKKAKIHPFVVSKLSRSLNQPIQKLKDDFNVFARIEILSKQGRVDVEDSLYNFVLNC